MLRHLRRLLISLAAVVAAWLLYALTVVPLVDPQVQRSAQAGSADVPDDDSPELTQTTFHDRLVPLFPTGAWELDQPKVLETEQGVFLFQEYHELTDNRFEIRPCTLVTFSKPGLPTGDAKSVAGRAIVVQAPQGAQLQFDSDSDLPRFKFGRLLGGRLPGEIRIWSHDAEGGEPLELTTRNIQIEERRIWTTQDVQFRFGASHGRGRDLEIRLQRTVDPDDPSEHSAMGSAMGNVQSVELVHLEELHLDGLDTPAVAKPASTEVPTATAPQPPDPASPAGIPLSGGPIDVSCRGSARFNVVDLVATLEDQVVVVRQVDGSLPDRLTCDVLTLVLRQQPGGRVGARPDHAVHPQFEIERLIATGQAVELTAPSRQAKAQGQRLEINVPARRLRLEGGQGATLTHDMLQLSAVHLEYELPESNAGLGRAWAQGPGQLVGHLRGAQSTARCEATWGGELQLRPHEGLQVVSLTGGASIDYEGWGRFAADALHLWLRALPAGESEPRTQLVAERMLAQNNVSVNSRQLIAHTKRVEAWFRDVPEGPVATADAGPVGRLASRGEPIPPGRRLPNARATPAEPESPDASPTQFDVRGELVRAALLRSGSGSIELETLEVTGDVVISEQTADPAVDNPLVIRGDRLRLEQTPGGHGLLRVIGQPARVTARGMTLNGAEVRLDQATNQLTIPGPGEMSLPPFDLKPKSRTGVLYENPRAAAAPASASVGRPTVITWKNGLEFDGQTARFNQDVQVRASQRLSTGEWLELLLLGGELDVRLANRVNFAVTDGPPPQAAVDTLHFGGNVYVDGRTLQGDNLTSYERMQLRNLTIHQVTGHLTGDGPGWLAGARRNDSPHDSGGNPEPRPAPASNGQLVFLHVAFERGIQGQLVDRQVEFLDRVRAVFGGVPNWQTELDPERPDEWPPDAMELRCDRLSVAQQGGAAPGLTAAELSAIGNATVEGRKFVARAARISYSQAKDLVVLAGDGRSDAEFWKKPRNSAKADAAATTIMFWRRTNKVTVSGVKFVDLNAIGP